MLVFYGGYASLAHHVTHGIPILEGYSATETSLELDKNRGLFESLGERLPLAADSRSGGKPNKKSQLSSSLFLTGSLKTTFC